MRYSVIHREITGQPKKRRVRRFTDDDYVTAGGSITGVKTPASKQVAVLTDKGATSIATIIKEVLTFNSIKPKKVTYPSKKKVKFVFESKENAQEAIDIINKMKGDDITEGCYNYKNKGNNYILTNHGNAIKTTSNVYLTEEVNEETGVTETVFNKPTPATAQTAGTEAGTGNTTKIIVIVGCIVAVIALVAVILWKKGVFKHK